MPKFRIKSLGTPSPEKLPAVVERSKADYLQMQAEDAKAIAVAYVYWTKYPLLVSLIGDDRQDERRQTAYDHLNRTHRKAAEILCRAADKLGIDGAAIYSSAEICRELYRDNPTVHRDGEGLGWPDCLGESRKALSEQDQATLRTSKTAALRLVQSISKPEPPAIETPTDKRNAWIYRECCKGTLYSKIRAELKKKPESWKRIGSIEGITKAADRYAKKNNLPLPPDRKTGRPTKKPKQ